MVEGWTRGETLNELNGLKKLNEERNLNHGLRGFHGYGKEGKAARKTRRH